MPARRDGTCNRILGLSPNLTSTKGGDIRQTFEGYVLLLQCFDSANVTETIDAFALVRFVRAKKGKNHVYGFGF